MLDLSHEDSIFIALSSTNNVGFDNKHRPTRQKLNQSGWRETTVGIAPEREVIVRGGLVAKRHQYTLKHIGATTIEKSQGATLPNGLALEITSDYSPWDAGQIVVILSRAHTASQTIIVGSKTFAVGKMWELIRKPNQWTRYSKLILDAISINTEDTPQDHLNKFEFPEAFPFRRIDAELPVDRTGHVYCLTSVPNPQKIYIGQTECITQRFSQHRQGTGASGTEDERDRPWGMGALICGLGHMQKRERMSLEGSWKREIENMRRNGQHDAYHWIMSGQRLVGIHNGGASIQHQIRCVSYVEQDNFED